MTDGIQLKVFIWIMIWLQSHLKALVSTILTQEDLIILKYSIISINELEMKERIKVIAFCNVPTAQNIKPSIHLDCPWTDHYLISP